MASTGANSSTATPQRVTVRRHYNELARSTITMGPQFSGLRAIQHSE
jgi:hypothetical protein